MTEVAVVGAGPVGLRIAERTAKAGYETKVLEKGASIGKPVQCAGLVSDRVVSMTGTDSVIGFPQKAVMNSPSGRSLPIKTDERRAAVIDRTKFDREMAQKAVKAGAEISLKTSVKSAEIGDKRRLFYNKEGEERSLEADVVIGADGPGSVIRKSADLPDPEEVLPAVQAVVTSEDTSVQIHLGGETAPGFFLYELPYKTGKLIGLASDDGNTYAHLMDFLKSRDLEDKIITFLSGAIPLGNLDKTVSDRLLLAGDAACHIKPLSGGGIYLGLKAADICSEVLIKALKEGDLSEKRLYKYHERCQETIGKQISRGMKMREVFKDLSDEDLDEVIRTLNNQKAREVIEKKGDIDFPSRVVKPLLKTSPKLLKFTGPVLKSIF